MDKAKLLLICGIIWQVNTAFANQMSASARESPKPQSQAEGEEFTRKLLHNGFNSTQGSVSRNAENFAQAELDRHEAHNPYNNEAEQVANNYEQIRETHVFKDAQLHARNVAKQEPFEVEEVQGKLANAQGVNLNIALSRYWKKFNDGKKRQETLPDLMVFVSFSMPEQSLKELSEQAKRVGGQLVFRGMVKNSMKTTVQAMLALNQGGVKAIIHPKLYEKFAVTHVPTYVLLDSKQSYCTEGDCSPLHDRMSGNVSLEYALREFASNGDYKEIASGLLRKE